MTQVILTPSAAAEVAVSATSNTVKSGILFGRERSGLTNEEVALADSIISIPSFRHFSSLNLAQAVNIVGFELWKRNIELSSQSPPEKWLAPVNPGISTPPSPPLPTTRNPTYHILPLPN